MSPKLALKLLLDVPDYRYVSFRMRKDIPCRHDQGDKIIGEENGGAKWHSSISFFSSLISH